jgi:hypothetical protein
VNSPAILPGTFPVLLYTPKREDDFQIGRAVAGA